MLDQDGFEGYSLLAAAGDGCASCVKHWLEKGVDPNFESSSSRYNAMDFVLWAEKKSRVGAASSKQVKEMLFRRSIAAAFDQNPEEMRVFLRRRSE